MNTSLPDACYSTFPSIANAAIISNTYKIKALHSIHHLITSLQKVVRISMPDATSLLDQIYPHKASASLYAFNSTLVDTILKEKNINRAIELLDDFSGQRIDKFITTTPKTSGIDSHEWSLEFANDAINNINKIREYGIAHSEIEELNENAFNNNKKTIDAALKILRSDNTNEYYNEISQYISDIIIFGGRGITGGTAERAMGAIFIRTPENNPSLETNAFTCINPYLYYIEQIIHETAHVHLNQLMTFDPLILNDPTDRFESPVRKDKRPMRGVYHATFVLARLVNVLVNINNLDKSMEEERQNRLPLLKSALKRGLSTIITFGKLNDHGEIILSEMKQILNDT